MAAPFPYRGVPPGMPPGVPPVVVPPVVPPGVSPIVPPPAPVPDYMSEEKLQEKGTFCVQFSTLLQADIFPFVCERTFNSVQF